MNKHILYLNYIYYTYIGAINSFGGSYVPICWQRFFILVYTFFTFIYIYLHFKIFAKVITHHLFIIH